MNPQSTLAAAMTDSAPAADGLRLFDRKSVLIAAVLGSPLAGAILMAINESRWGRRSSASRTVVIAALATALLLVVGYLTNRLSSVIPQYEFIVGLTCALITAQIAHSWQGSAIKRHVEAGGALASQWLAAAVGLALLAVIAAVVIGVALLSDSKVVIGSNDRVHYSAPASKPDALHLGEVLKNIGYFRDKGADVLLSKPPSGTRVSFVLQSGAWDQPDIVAGYERVGLLVAGQIGFPLHLALVDDQQQPRKELIVARLTVGTRDTVLYFGSSTESQARALGAALKTAGYLQDRGVMVLLSQEGDGISISFPVVEGAWDKQDIIDYFVDLARRSEAVLGTVRVKLRLLDSSLAVKKELLVT